MVRRGRVRPGRPGRASRAEIRMPGTLARQRPAREPRAGHDAADRRGRAARPRGQGPVPHRRVPDGGTAPGRRARRSASTCCRCPRTSSAARRAWARSTSAAASGVTAYPCGDDRERKRRSGMENTPGIAGMAAALTASLATMGDAAAHAMGPHRAPARADRGDGAGRDRPRPPHPPHARTSSASAWRGSTRPRSMMALDDRGFRVGAGSLCSGRPRTPRRCWRPIGRRTRPPGSASASAPPRPRPTSTRSSRRCRTSWRSCERSSRSAARPSRGSGRRPSVDPASERPYSTVQVSPPCSSLCRSPLPRRSSALRSCAVIASP